MSYNEERETKHLEDVQNGNPGAKQRLRGMQEDERRMKEFDEEFGFPPPRVDPQRDPKTRMRREIYESLGN